MSTCSKVITRTDTQTDRQTDMMKTLPLPHTREVINGSVCHRRQCQLRWIENNEMHRYFSYSDGKLSLAEDAAAGGN